MKNFWVVGLLFLTATVFADDIQVYRGSANDFAPSFQGITEDVTLFFGQADLKEGTFLELYNPALGSSGVARRTAQILIVKRTKPAGDDNGLILSPAASNYFNLERSGYLISNPRNNYSINSSTPPEEEPTPPEEEPTPPVPEPNVPLAPPPTTDPAPTNEVLDFTMFGSSVTYYMEEAEAKPAQDTNPINPGDWIDEYENTDVPPITDENPVVPQKVDQTPSLPPPPEEPKPVEVTPQPVEQPPLKSQSNFIQVGFYTDENLLRTNEERIKTRLPTVVQEHTLPDGRKGYRLLVGAFKPDELGVSAYTLRILGYNDFFLVSTN